MLLSILFLVVVQCVFIQTIPMTVDENEDIMATLARLHHETDKVRYRLNPVPDLITFASNNVADRLKRYVHTPKSTADSDTVYVKLNVDPDEEFETKYVNLYIDTKRHINAKYATLQKVSDYTDTKLIHLQENPLINTRPYPPYRHFRRQMK